jgi:hypothetical protein
MIYIFLWSFKMYTPIIEQTVPTNRKKHSITRIALAITLAGFSLAIHAGKITSTPSATVPGVQNNFGGLGLANIEVIMNGALSTFDELTGAYSFSPDSDLTYQASVFDDDVGTTTMAYVQAKPWPIGEPTGIKIVNDDFDVKNGKPSNCIMSTSYLDGHYLDAAEPEMVLCSGPFQSHKRYKVAMLPATIDAVGQESIDLVFNVEQDGTSRDYQIFQKINNWTDKRLQGFTIQVGTGQGAAFVPAADPTTGVGVTNLSLSVPSEVWGASQLANFSTGLFGPIDTKHGRPAGFFDPTKRAGFSIIEYGAGNTGDASGQTDKLTSGAILPSAYPDVPAGAGAAPNYQFGNWLPNNMLPFGIFFDDDGNPDTDAVLKAWYGYNPTLGGLHWMKGVADNFELVADATITTVWGNDPLYSMSVIDDLVNVGLSYVVTIADISNFPGYNADPALNAATFTIRITPAVEAVATPKPTYADVIPVPTLAYTSSDAIITLNPSPEFVPGSLLTVRVADADLNIPPAIPTDPPTIDTTTVNVITSDGSVAPATITLNELGPDRGVFVANLPDAFSNVAPGVTVTATYIDVAGGTIADEPNTATSTASGSVAAGLLSFNPATYTVAENDGSVTVTVERTGGTDGEVTVEYNTLSGTAIGNADYLPDTSTLFFADGETTQTITVLLVNDTAVESDETFSILLSNAQGGATLGTASTAAVTITNDDTSIVSSTSSNDDGGGWCSYNPNGRFDPILPGLILAALAYLGWRLKKRAQ